MYYDKWAEVYDLVYSNYKVDIDFYKKEFELLLRIAGFKKWIVYGSFDYQPLKSSTQEMVWIVKN